MKAVVAFLLLCYPAISAAVHCVQGPRLYRACQIDASQGMVVATTLSRYPYFLSGRTWYRLFYARIKHVTVGPAGIWGAGNGNLVYRFICGRFRPARGKRMKQVDAGGRKNLVGVTPTNQANCLRKQRTLGFNGIGTLIWNTIANLARRPLKYISTTCFRNGATWGVTLRHRIVCSKASNANTCGFTPFVYVPGSLKMVEISTHGKVFGVNKAGKVFQRVGITPRRPHGTAWRFIPMCMTIKHVSYDLRRLWAVTRSGLILKCTL